MWIRLEALPSHANYDVPDKDNDLLSVGLTSCQAVGLRLKNSSTGSAYSSDCVRHQFLQRRVSPARSIRGRDVVRIETGANYHQPADYNIDALPDRERTE